MSDARLQFLFGAALPGEADLEEIDLDDVDVRAELLRQTHPPGTEPLRELFTEAIASQIHLDDPPEVWAAAERLLASGLTRDEVFEQLALAAAPYFRNALETGRPPDLDAYRTALAGLPWPTPTQVIDAIVDTLRVDQGIDCEVLHAAAMARLGFDPDDEAAAELVDEQLVHLVDELQSVAYLPDDRMVHLPSLLESVVLTHRLSRAEAEAEVLDASFDLAAFDRPTLLLPTGEEVAVVSMEPGHLAWMGPVGWLGDVESGDVLAVTVDGDDVVSVRPVAPPPEPDPELVARIRSTYDAVAERYSRPMEGDQLVLSLAVDAPELVRRAQAPLAELARAAGLEVRRHLAADDERMWAAHRRSVRMQTVLGAAGYDELEHARQAVGVLSLAEALSGADPAAADGPDGRMSGETLRLTLRHLADPAVMQTVWELLAGEDGSWYPDDGAGLDGLDLPGLIDALDGVASRSRERAVVRLLAALAAEVNGDAIEAERCLRQARDADPANPVVTDRAAWYASDRGDAATAARLWRSLRGEGPHLADLAEVERHQTGGGSRLGRNQPCWCGSGRKYKQCHLGATELEPLPDRVGWLWHKAVSHLNRAPRTVTGLVADIAEVRATDPTDVESLADAYADPIVFDLALTEGGWFEIFLEERGPLLPEDEQLLAASWLAVDRTIYEVEDVEAGAGLVVRDLRTGDRIEVRERAQRRRAQPQEMLCGRAVPDGSSHQFVGGLFPVAPGRERALLDLLDEGHPQEIAAWVAALHRPPEIRNREGEELVDCELVVKVADPEAARSLLDVTFEPGQVGGGGGDGATLSDDRADGHWTELHPLDGDESLVRAQLRLDGDRLTVTANSVERIDRLRSVLADSLPGARILTDRRRPMDPGELLGRRARAGAGSPAGALGAFSGPEGPGGVGSLPRPDELEEVRRMLEERWCDESVPALGGVTPREAAADPTRRPELIRLLASFGGDDDTPGALTFRPSRLRQLLQL